MQQPGRKRRLSHEINVVPYIDVMLVLVVIFMATATIALGVQVELPQAQVKPMDNSGQQELPIQLTVKSDGKMQLNIAPDPNATLSPDEIVKYVSVELKLKPKRSIIVAGDRHADYDTIMKAMGYLQQGGAETIGLQSNPIVQQ